MATANNMKEIEARYATVEGILEQEKHSHQITIGKLSTEEANHIATIQLLEQEKHCVNAIQLELDFERSNIIEVSHLPIYFKLGIISVKMFQLCSFKLQSSRIWSSLTIRKTEPYFLE